MLDLYSCSIFYCMTIIKQLFSVIFVSFCVSSNWTEEISAEGFLSFRYVNRVGNLCMLFPKVNICWGLVSQCLVMHKFNLHWDQFRKLNFIHLSLLWIFQLFHVFDRVSNRYQENFTHQAGITKWTIWYLSLFLSRDFMFYCLTAVIKLCLGAVAHGRG